MCKGDYYTRKKERNNRHTEQKNVFVFFFEKRENSTRDKQTILDTFYTLNYVILI